MNYLTNYYKNKCEILEQRIHQLTRLVEMAAPMPTELEMPTSMADNTQAPQTPPIRERDRGNGGRDGELSPGYEGPHKKGPKSKEWRKWISNPANYHRSNPHKVGSDEFYQWEWEYYEQPPGP
jgi:hypothetical protein